MSTPAEHVFRRKLYDQLLQWKQEDNGRNAMLIEGARRVGKSTLVRSFAQNEYDSFIFIDFSNASQDVNALFDDISNLDKLFVRLQFEYNVKLIPRKSVIVFDEVQFNPRARQAIKHLVADGRYDYIETGSLISIHKNVKDILIPSEENSLELHPLDFEEFCWAIGNAAIPDLLRQILHDKHPLSDLVHRKLMRDFRLYMLVGGMPQAVSTYLSTLNLAEVDSVKRAIIKLYENDFKKIDNSGRLGRMFDDIPAQLGRSASRYMLKPAIGRTTQNKEDALISEISESKTVNLCYHTADPSNGLAMDYDKDYFKMYTADTGLFVSLAFKDKHFTENVIYQKLLSDKLDANLGYVYENMVAQMLVAAGRKLFYYTFPNDNRHLFEVDFLIGSGNKLNPIEVKSANYRAHASLDAFCNKFSRKIKQPVVVHTKDFGKIGPVLYIPVYTLPFFLENC